MPLKLGSNVDMSNVVKSLGKKFKLVPHLDVAIGEGEFAWDAHFEPKQDDDAWHPSGDCTPSLFDLYMKAVGKTEPQGFSGALRKTFVVGHFWHQYLQWIVEKKLGFCDADAIERRGAKGWIRPERDGFLRWVHEEPHLCKPYHWATGAGDIAPCVIPGYGEYVIDFKTQNSRSFKQQGLPDWCVDKYEAQINIYMDFFDMERGIILCIDKDSPHDMKEIEYARNQPLIDAVYAKWALVSECVDEGIVPPVDEPWDLPLTGPVA